MSWLFPSGGQSIGTSASVLPMTIQGWFPLGLIGLVSLQPKVLSSVFSSIAVWKHQFFSVQPCLWSIRQWLLEKPQLWLYYLGGDTLRLRKLFILKFLPTHFSTNWGILSATIIYSDVCLMVIPPHPISCFFINWKFIVRKSCPFPFIYLIVYISMD